MAIALSHTGPLVTGGYDVVCFPIIPWDLRFQRPQQLLCRFAAAGHRVFYLDPGFRQAGEPATFRSIRHGIVEASLRGPELNIYASQMSQADVDALFEGLDFLRRVSAIGTAVSLVDLPFWWPLAARARDAFGWPVVYDCMDHHAGFEIVGAAVVDEEPSLFRGAELVTVSSRVLEDKARPLNPRVLVVRNACDFDHFAGPPAADATRPMIGYYGAIAQWFDVDLVADLAERRADWQFVLIGHTSGADVTRLTRLANVQLIGEVPYGDLPRWLARFDVTILPFRRIPLTEATNPVKVYETLASGKAVVSVPLPELQTLSGLVRLAATAAEFDREISAELAGPGHQAILARRSFAATQTWQHRFAAMEPAVRQTFPSLSIVVVTYNNVHLTALCLASLQAQKPWPRCEIVVVDNGSTDETADYLRHVEAHSEGVRVILNRENLGFAAANNQALRDVSSDYVVLLNNDTIVTHGSLAALIRHLHGDGSLGLVGPVTNNVGNEARIHVGYSSLADLASWSEGWMRDHDGETFDIPMAAMFCVASRRDVLERVGLLDERFGIGLFEDDDYSRRVREAGYRVACARDSYVHHWRRAAFNRMPTQDYQQLFDRNRRAFEEKWGVAWTPHAYAASTSFAD